MVAFIKYSIVAILTGVFLFYLKKYMNGVACESKARIPDQVVIVTGANTGIGKETVAQLAERGGKVYMACRSLERCGRAKDEILQRLQADAQLEMLQLNLASFKSVRSFAKEFLSRERHLNILVNNAGIFTYNNNKTEDGIEMHFGVNHLGHFLLTNLLMESLLAGVPSRIINLSSNMYYFGEMHWDDLNLETAFSSVDAYSQSKLANILFTRYLANHLTGHEITANSVNPGAVSTDVMRDWPVICHDVVYALLWPLLKDVYSGAQTTVCLAVHPVHEKVSGKHFSDCAEVTVTDAASSDRDSHRLWEQSVKMSGLRQDEIHPLLNP